MKHLPSYNFPYLVDFATPTTQRVIPLSLPKQPTPLQNGSLKPYLKAEIIKTTSDLSIITKTLLCIVFDIKDCVYCTLDGSITPSNNPPTTDLVPSIEIPEGLTPCDRCGYLKGECFHQGEGAKVTVSCCCEAHICPKCQTPVYKFKITGNTFNFVDGLIWHTPVFCAWAHKCV